MSTPEDKFERHELIPQPPLGMRILADELRIPVDQLPKEAPVRRRTGVTRSVPPVQETDEPTPLPHRLKLDEI